MVHKRIGAAASLALIALLVLAACGNAPNAQALSSAFLRADVRRLVQGAEQSAWREGEDL